MLLFVLMELDEKDSKTLFQAGLCFQKKGMKEKGENLCDKAIELDPSLESLRTKRDISIFEKDENLLIPKNIAKNIFQNYITTIGYGTQLSNSFVVMHC